MLYYLRRCYRVEFKTIAKFRRLALTARYFTITNSIRFNSTSPPATETHNVRVVYERRVAEGRLINDSFQLKVVERFDALFEEIKSYQPSTSTSSGLSLKVLKKLFGGRAAKQDESTEQFLSSIGSPKGVYLYGTVGCGKTMLMDLFYECCTIGRKRRVHYHSFMNDIHRRIHQLKTTDSQRSAADVRDPILLVAADIVDQAWLLCLDEFQVTDVADAMILKHLFTEIFKRGAVVVATSNRAPDDLYKNGLQRSNFLPFIAMLKRRCHCVCLDSHIDYRQKSAHSATAQFYFVKKQQEDRDDADAQLTRIFKIMSARETDTVRPKILNVFGRHLELKKTCGGLLDITFDELCVKPLGASDYIALSQAFHTVLVRDVPIFRQNALGPARRFITLIDTFYDFHVRLVISAEASLDKLFQLDDADDDDVNTPSDQNRMLMDDLKISATDDGAKANVFTGAEELFAYDRTISRLVEMQSKEYWRHREPSSSSSSTSS